MAKRQRAPEQPPGRRDERIRLVVWNTAEAEVKARVLRRAGYTVDASLITGAGLRALRADPPHAVIIDLGRIPSQGRDVAVHLRHSPSTQSIPLVFVDGEGEKLERVKALIPDAVYTPWEAAPAAIRRAIDEPPGDPVRTSSVFAAYASTPVATKLGIQVGSIVDLSGAPRGFERALEPLPEGVKLRRRSGRKAANLALWFPRNQRDLEDRVGAMAKRVPPGGLWIVWPKQSSARATDLTQTVVRRMGLSAGLVDYKVVRIDETWTGLRFTRRSARTR